MSIETFGKYVSYLRTSRDFSLREFADMIELSPYYLCSIENGRRTNPKIKMLGKMYLVLKLRKEEMEKLLDLYAKANGQVSADIIDYIMENNDTLSHLRKERDSVSEQYWNIFMIDLQPKCNKIHKKLRSNSAGERKPRRFLGRLLIRSTTV